MSTAGTKRSAGGGGEGGRVSKRVRLEGGDELAFPVTCDNLIGGKMVVPSSGEYKDIVSPSRGVKIGTVALSTAADVDAAVTAARAALPAWSSLTIKARAQIMLKYHALVREYTQELAEIVVEENGKTISEAIAGVAKGNEVRPRARPLPALRLTRLARVADG